MAKRRSKTIRKIHNGYSATDRGIIFLNIVVYMVLFFILVQYLQSIHITALAQEQMIANSLVQ